MKPKPKVREWLRWERIKKMFILAIVLVAIGVVATIAIWWNHSRTARAEASANSTATEFITDQNAEPKPQPKEEEIKNPPAVEEKEAPTQTTTKTTSVEKTEEKGQQTSSTTTETTSTTTTQSAAAPPQPRADPVLACVSEYAGGGLRLCYASCELIQAVVECTGSLTNTSEYAEQLDMKEGAYAEDNAGNHPRIYLANFRFGSNFSAILSPGHPATFTFRYNDPSRGTATKVLPTIKIDWRGGYAYITPCADIPIVNK